MREGRFIHTWKVAVCLHCVTGNREGLSVKHPAIRQLAQRGINLKPAGNGIVPWPGNEPPPAAQARPGGSNCAA
jgi:hypothetical protein